MSDFTATVTMSGQSAQETNVTLAYKVKQSVTFTAASVDGNIIYGVDRREICSPWVGFSPCICNFSSLESSERCIGGMLSELQIPTELSQHFMPPFADYACNAVRIAKEKRSPSLWIAFEINVLTERRLSDQELQELVDSLERGGFGAVPATDAEIETALKTIVFKSDTESAKYDCTVCLNEFVEDSEVCQMPCLHVFHGECIISWLMQSNCCPICRFKLRN